MPSFWKNILEVLFPDDDNPQGDQSRPTKPPIKKNSNSKNKNYSNAYNSLADDKQIAERPEVFEPALKHYPNAFRVGDPVLETPETRDQWNNARMRVIDHLLNIVKNSQWKDNLVLRGSLLLRAWLGNAARNPGDIDWVVRPNYLGLNDSFSQEFFDGLIQIVSTGSHFKDIVIEVDKIAVDDIWTYERAPGRRVVFPWRADGLPLGSIQMDFVFGEELWTPAVQVEIPTVADSSILVWGASKELSLAWKLMWLETDSYPQGKDLYDAALLAEQTYLSPKLLKQVLESDEWNVRVEVAPDFPMNWEVDWSNFQLEYPWITGTATDWQHRLTKALAPTFANAD